jgi:hypothetical protein
MARGPRDCWHVRRQRPADYGLLWTNRHAVAREVADCIWPRSVGSIQRSTSGWLTVESTLSVSRHAHWPEARQAPISLACRRPENATHSHRNAVARAKARRSVTCLSGHDVQVECCGAAGRPLLLTSLLQLDGAHRATHHAVAAADTAVKIDSGCAIDNRDGRPNWHRSAQASQALQCSWSTVAR